MRSNMELDPSGTITGPGGLDIGSLLPSHSQLFWNGGAIRGTLIDLWKTCDDAVRWGRRPVTIYVLDS